MRNNDEFTSIGIKEFVGGQTARVKLISSTIKYA